MGDSLSSVSEHLASHLSHSSLILVIADPSPSTVETSPAAASPLPTEPSTPEHRQPFQAGNRVWTATTLEDSEVKNKPQCPPCARLKRTWTRCRGGPPCIECQHRGLSAEQCQSYDLLNRSRKNRQQKKKDQIYKMLELRDQAQEERIRDDVTEGEEVTGGLDSL